jgi:capsid assembly protease
MSQHLARSIVTGLNLRAALISPAHHQLGATLRDIAAAQPAAEREAFEARKAEMVEAYGLAPMPQSKPFAFSGGKAIVPVHGVLVNRLASSWGYVTGYSFIRAQMAAAAADDEVDTIVLDIHSPGGTVAGCPECADAIKAAAAVKPVLAVVDSSVYSAAYWLASAASHIAVTPSGGVGSIGVVAVHLSLEKMLEEIGIEVTIIQAGEHKTDGNPFEALPASVRKEIQAEVDELYGEFVATVAANRGLDERAVRATEARCYRASEALTLGLIDSVQTPSAALASFALADDEAEENEDMATEQNKPQPDAQPGAQPGAGQPAPQQPAAPSAEALATARREERERMAGITGSEEAKGKGKLAHHLATATDMSVVDAKAVLAAAAPEVPDAAAGKDQGDRFAAAMDNSRHPNIGPDGKDAKGGGQGEDQEDTPAARANGILADAGRLTGRKFEADGKPAK